MRERARSPRGSRAEPGLSRRAWLGGAASAWLVAASKADEQGQGPADNDPRFKDVEAHARSVGLRSFRSTRSCHYLAAGDADSVFQRLTLRDCELIAQDYLDHFRDKGFAVVPPGRRLMVVTLADERSYAAFLGTRLAQSTSGFYDRKTGALIVYDARRAPQQAIRAGHANLRNLAHEATHQLTFDTGLLNPRADTPLCIIEGLGMYSEVRKLSGRTEPGQVNTVRLSDLAHKQRRYGWIPVATLLADDDLLWSPELDGRLLAYAESWLLVYTLMHEPALLSSFRAYLETVRNLTGATTRPEVARAHWGDLDRLDQDLRRMSIRLLRNPPP